MEPYEATEPQHEKPMLTVEEQIAHLKEKGVKFELKQRRKDAYCGAVIGK